MCFIYVQLQIFLKFFGCWNVTSKQLIPLATRNTSSWSFSGNSPSCTEKFTSSQTYWSAFKEKNGGSPPSQSLANQHLGVPVQACSGEPPALCPDKFISHKIRELRHMLVPDTNSHPSVKVSLMLVDLKGTS